MMNPIVHEIRRFDRLDSTNDYILRNADLLKSGTVVMAGYQSEGKGTQGRTWQSDANENLLFSLIYKDEPFTGYPLFSLRIALALTFVLEENGLFPQIKWPNDILIDDKKIAGILIEVKRNICVVGIGFNINQQEFPTDQDLSATSLYNLLDKEIEPVGVLLKVLDALDEVLILNDSEVLPKYRSMLYQKGKTCVVNINQNRFVATIIDIDDDGVLVVTDNQNQKFKIHSKAMLERSVF